MDWDTFLTLGDTWGFYLSHVLTLRHCYNFTLLDLGLRLWTLDLNLGLCYQLIDEWKTNIFTNICLDWKVPRKHSETFEKCKKIL